MAEKKNGDEIEYYATVRWCWEDVKKLSPAWSRDKCEEFLSINESRVADRMTEIGWDVIEGLMVGFGGEDE